VGGKEEKQKGCQVSTTKTTTHHTTSPPIPLPIARLAREGSRSPTAPPSTTCSPVSARNRATAARLRVFGPHLSLPRVSRAHSPTTTTTTSHAPPYHLYAPYAPSQKSSSPNPPPHVTFRERTTPPPPPLPRTAPRHPKPSHKSSVSGFGPTPLPMSHFASAQPHHHHHYLVRATAAPLCTRALNRTKARFWVLAQPPPRVVFRERTTPPHHHYLIPHRRFIHTARPKPSHKSSVSGFGPTPLSASRFASAQPHHHHHHHHHLIRTTALPPSAALHLHFRRRARNRAPVARFQVN
jgi:hypothetical protein